MEDKVIQIIGLPLWKVGVLVSSEACRSHWWTYKWCGQIPCSSIWWRIPEISHLFSTHKSGWPQCRWTSAGCEVAQRSIQWTPPTTLIRDYVGRSSSYGVPWEDGREQYPNPTGVNLEASNALLPDQTVKEFGPLWPRPKVTAIYPRGSNLPSFQLGKTI